MNAQISLAFESLVLQISQTKFCDITCNIPDPKSVNKDNLNQFAVSRSKSDSIQGRSLEPLDRIAKPGQKVGKQER